MRVAAVAARQHRTSIRMFFRTTDASGQRRRHDVGRELLRRHGPVNPGVSMPVSGVTWPPATRADQRDDHALHRRLFVSSSTGVPESVKTKLKHMISAGYEHRGDEDTARGRWRWTLVSARPTNSICRSGAEVPYEVLAAPIGRASRARRRLCAPTTDDGMGGQVAADSNGWITVARPWVAVTALDERMKEGIEGSQLTAQHRYHVDMRYQSGVQVEMRLRWRDKVLSIQSVADDEGLARRLILLCGEVQ
jgi:head-tail adaptor